MNVYTSSQKLDLIHWITELNDVSVLEKVKAIKESTTQVSSAELQSIKRGLGDFGQGKVVSHAQARKRYEKWL